MELSGPSSGWQDGSPVDGAFPSPGALRLRPIDETILSTARALALALDGHSQGDLVFRATVATAPPPRGFWIAASSGMALLDGGAQILTAERTAAVADAIDRLDPIWDAIEVTLGVPLEFDDTADSAPDGAVAVHIAWSGGWSSAALFVPLVAVPPGPPPPPAPAAIVPLRLVCDGPRLSVEDAASLADGDLLIWPAGAWRAALSVPGRADRPGVFDAMTGRWMDGEGATMSDADATEPPDGDDGGARGFAVGLSLRLPPMSVTVGELEALRPGATLPLGPVTAGLEVALEVAGRAVATGELVRLGDQFAVLVTAGAAAHRSAPATED